MTEKPHRFALKLLKMVAIITLASLFLVPTGAKVYCEIKYNDYANNSQIETIAHALNFDLSYVLPIGTNPRLIHNDGESIQVIVDEDLQEHIEYIKEAMDYMINTINAVNNLYSYKFIEKNNEKTNISTIHFESQTLEYLEAGKIDLFKKPMDTVLLNKTLIHKIHINIDKDQMADLPKSWYFYIYLHEIVHAFGLRGDTYLYETTNSHIGNTIINVELGQKVPMLTPNDICGAYTLYTPQTRSDEELALKIAEYKTFLDDYEKKYNKFYTNQVINYLKKAYSDDIQFNGFNLNDNFTFISSDNSNNWLYEVYYFDNNYKIKIYDENNNLFDESSGKVLYDNNIIVLKDVTLKYGIFVNDINHAPDGFVQDLALYNNNGKIALYDICKNAILTGKTFYNQNTLVN